MTAEPTLRANDPLPPDSSVTRVSLVVRHLERTARFYDHVVGLDEVDAGPGSVMLGARETGFLELIEDPVAEQVPDSPGLYHLAILYPSREDLAAVTARVTGLGAPFQGASDHGVSEACYFVDPEGNGLEVYRDRAPNEWPTREGRIDMRTLPLDVRALLAEAPDLEAWRVPPSTRLGHVHLRVAHVAEAEAFYRRVVGLDLVQRYGDSASFLSAGGYHHHVAVNSWETAGSAARPPGAAGLNWFEIAVPDSDAMSRLGDRLRTTQVPHVIQGATAYLSDPSGNDLVIRVVPGPTRGTSK